MVDSSFWPDLITAVAPIAVAMIGLVPVIHEQGKKTNDKIDSIAKKLDSHIAESEEVNAKDARQRILQFASEVRKGEIHDEDEWSAISLDCESYLKYSESHPNFPDGICKTKIKFLQETLADLIDEGKIE